LRWGLALAAAVTVSATQDAQASRIVYSCAPELCVVDPETLGSQTLTTDGATAPYRFPSTSRDGTRIAAERASEVMVGAYGTNLTQSWTRSRSINDVALAPDGSGIGESHSYVENRYGCPFTGGCL
jgi:Tol biopolymer transport system component